MNNIMTGKPLAVRLLVIILVAILVGTGYYLVTEDLLVSRNKYELDLKDFNKIDPAMIDYRQVQSLDTGDRKPQAIAVDKGSNIFVAADSEILVFNRFGSLDKVLPAGAPVYCLAVAPNGELFLGFKAAIATLDLESGAINEFASLDDNARLTSLAVGRNYAYAADAGNRIVNQYNRDGDFLRTIGEKDLANDRLGFIIPSPYFDVAIESMESIWIVNPGQHLLENFRPDGELVGQWGEFTAELRGFCGCCNPSHFALLPDGRFVTSEKGLVRVKIYSDDGKLDKVVAGPESFSLNATGLDIAIDGSQRILVLDPGAKKVRIFQPKEAS